jgi:hypothetical protein
MVEGLSAKLLPILAPLQPPRIVAFLRLFFVHAARQVTVSGCSYKAITMRTAEELLEASARVLTVLLPDQQRVRDTFDIALAAVASDPSWNDAARPVPDPDMSPLRGASPSPTATASAPRAGSLPLTDDVASEALRLLSEQARRAKPWRSSHELTEDDGFTSSELSLLRTLPAYGWTADDENRDVLLRAVRAIARHIAKHQATPLGDVIHDLRQQLKLSRRTLAPTWLGGLQLAVHTGDDRAARIAVAELALTAEADVDELLFARVVLARQMPRTDKSEATAVLGAKSTLACAVGDLPIRLRERISRLS